MRKRVLVAIVSASVLAQSIQAQDTATVRRRAWSPVIATVGLSFGSTSIDPGEGADCLTALGSLGLGVRINDFVGVLVGTDKMPCDADQTDFRMLSVDFYPISVSGQRNVRLSVAYGSSKIRITPYAGGHARDETKGTPPAWALSAAIDKRVSHYFVLSPYMTVTRTVGSGLTHQYCSTPNYSLGDFTEVCSSGTAKPLSLLMVGLSMGIR